MPERGESPHAFKFESALSSLNSASESKWQEFDRFIPAGVAWKNNIHGTSYMWPHEPAGRCTDLLVHPSH